MARDFVEFIFNSNLYEGLRPKHEKQLRVVALFVLAQSKMRCPVDTGRLRSSIHVTFKKDSHGRLMATVGTPVEYAPYVEFGTKRTPAQPFFRAAIGAARSKYGGTT